MNVEIAALSTRSRIQHLATTKLNLIYPEPQQVVWHQDSRDRFRNFDTNESLLVNANEILDQILTIGTVEANDTR